MTRLPFDLDLAHYDPAPPATLGADDLASLQEADRFRFANRLTRMDRGRRRAHRRVGSGRPRADRLDHHPARPSGSHLRRGSLPDLRREPEVGDGWVRFSQTAGGRTGVPTPRHVNRPPFVQVSAPTGLDDALPHAA